MSADPVPPPDSHAAALASETAGASPDAPIDAIVYDEHPALTTRGTPGGPNPAGADDAEYPYAAPPRGRLADAPLASAGSGPGVYASLVGLARGIDAFFIALRRPPDFVVPKTFGMSAILGIMTALAILFGCLRWLDAWPVLYFFFAIEALAICIAQMLNGHAPRLASIIAGTVILPAFAFFAAVFSHDFEAWMILAIVALVPCGALLGYLTGACAAGIFLVMDYVEPYLQPGGWARLRGVHGSRRPLGF
jgi:hypothetical protein